MLANTASKRTARVSSKSEHRGPIGVGPLTFLAATSAAAPRLLFGSRKSRAALCASGERICTTLGLSPIAARFDITEARRQDKRGASTGLVLKRRAVCTENADRLRTNSGRPLGPVIRLPIDLQAVVVSDGGVLRRRHSPASHPLSPYGRRRPASSARSSPGRPRPQRAETRNRMQAGMFRIECLTRGLIRGECYTVRCNSILWRSARPLDKSLCGGL